MDEIDATRSAAAAEIEPRVAESALIECHQSLRFLYRYWNAKRGTRKMPSRADIDPVDLKQVLRLLCLIDVVADGRRYVYRVVGSLDVDMRGYDPTGKSVKEGYYGESVESTTCYLDQVVQSRKPVLYCGTYQPSPARIEHDQVLFLPLSDNDDDVNKIFVLSHTVWLRNIDHFAEQIYSLLPATGAGRS